MSRSCVSLVLPYLVFLASGDWKACYAQTGAPDLILVNGRVFTGADSRPYAQAIAIKGPRISAIGMTQEILSIAGPKTRRIDLGERLVIPGINDSHVHFDEDPKGISVQSNEHDQTCVGALNQLRQAVRKTSPGVLVTGTIDQDAFFDPGCTPAALDKIAPENAVALWTPTLHAAILNQTAVRKFKVRTSDPPVLGGWFGKAMNGGQWDGVVQEYAWFRLLAMLPSDSAAEQTKLSRFLDSEARWGITSLTLIEAKPARRVKMLAQANAALRVRVVPSPFTTQGQRLQPEYPSVPARVSDRVSVSGVKWWLDGSPFERSCALRTPYADEPGTSGRVNFSPDEIRAILTEAGRRNTQVLLHTAGDRTAETLLRAMEATGGTETWPQRRLRIEHGDGLLPDLVSRATELGAIVVQNPTHLRAGDLLIQRFSPDRAAVNSPLHSLVAAGIKLVLASDGAAGEAELNPYLNIRLASAYPGKPQESY